MSNQLLTAKTQKEDLEIKMIKNIIAKIDKWANKKGMIFDLENFEAIHFLKKKLFSIQR